MSPAHPLQPIAENLWVQHFHLGLLGTEQGRVTTIIRLQSGDLVIHSTAPFSGDDVAAIRQLGTPRWMVDAMLLHDTFAKDALAAFPEVPLLGPPGFAEMAKVPAGSILPAPPEWGDELQVLALAGVPKLKEHVFLHRPSRTLIVADLVFNYDGKGNAWERFVRRYLIGLKIEPYFTRIFLALIQDKAAFRASMQQVMAWDFDRIIVGHKEVVSKDGKALLQRALTKAGLD